MGYYPKNTYFQLKHYTQSIYLTLLSTTCVKIHQITYVIFETISHFSRHNAAVSFKLKQYKLFTKVAHQSTNFQTCHCSHENFPNYSCHFWDQESVLFQTLHQSLFHETIVTINNIVWKLVRGYCLCYWKTFSLVPDSTECIKIFITEKQIILQFKRKTPAMKNPFIHD